MHERRPPSTKADVTNPYWERVSGMHGGKGGGLPRGGGGGGEQLMAFCGALRAWKVGRMVFVRSKRFLLSYCAPLLTEMW